MINKNIIDTHIHIWDLQKVRYDWLEGDASILNRTYLLDELLPEMAQTPVREGILVQAANNLADTALMLDAACRYPEITGVVGWLPLQHPGEVQKLLETQFAAAPYFKGVRHLIHNESDPRWLLQHNVLESLEILASYHIPYDVVGVHDEHLRTAMLVSEKIPALKLVLDHLNQPPISTGDRFGNWGALMKDIATNHNAYAKISGLGTASGNAAGWREEDIMPYVSYVLETFSTDRCFLGGDWPVSTLAGSYTVHWQRYTAVVRSLLDDTESNKVYNGNAAAFYNLKPPGTATIKP